MTLRDPYPIEKYENDNTFGNKLGKYFIPEKVPKIYDFY